MINFRWGDTADIPKIREVAYAVWPGAYGAIISEAQIEYMLKLFYSDTSLTKQMEEQHHRFIIAEELSTMDVDGFISYSFRKEDGIISIHKLYVMDHARGKHVGSSLIDQAIRRSRQLHPKAMQLNVNRHNVAIDFYKKLGFSVIRTEDNDIGNGYFMNDYVMEKKLLPVTNE